MPLNYLQWNKRFKSQLGVKPGDAKHWCELNTNFG
jgi:hypothetical protein